MAAHTRLRPNFGQDQRKYFFSMRTLISVYSEPVIIMYFVFGYRPYNIILLSVTLSVYLFLFVFCLHSALLCFAVLE